MNHYFVFALFFCDKIEIFSCDGLGWRGREGAVGRERWMIQFNAGKKSGRVEGGLRTSKTATSPRRQESKVLLRTTDCAVALSVHEPNGRSLLREWWAVH